MKNKKFFYAIIILATVLFFIGLGTRPFDGDEGIMVLIAQISWSDILTRAAADVHPPLYHSLLKLFISGGINEWSVRILSSLAGAGSVIIAYLFTKKLFSESRTPIMNMVALLSAFLLTISPYLIYPVQEARMYALFLFLALGSYYFFLKLIKDKSSWSKWIGYIIFSVLMLYTQYLGFVIIFSQIIYIIIYKLYFERNEVKSRSVQSNTKGFSSRPQWGSNSIFKWILSWIIIVILFLPQLPTMLNQFSARISEQSQALSISANIQGLIGAIYRFGSGRLFLDLNLTTLKSLMSEDPLLYIGLLLTLLIPFWLLIQGLIIVYKKFRMQFWFLAVPIIIAIILSIFSTEIGSRASRYLIYIFPFYIIFVSVGFLAYLSPVIPAKAGIYTNKHKWTIIIPILFLVISISGLVYHYTYENKAPGVDKIAEFLNDNYQDDDIVLVRGGFGGGESWTLRYYWNKLRVTSYELRVNDLLGDYSAGNLAELKAIKPEDKIQELLQEYNKIFFYDMTYETENIPSAEKYSLGQDKERKELTIWEVSK